MNLQETIRRILKEETQFSTEFKRRYKAFDDWVWDCYIARYPCESETFESFMKAIHAEIVEVINEGETIEGPISNWLTYEEGVEYVNRFMLDDLKKFYDEECEEY
jgi:hypothetical protein